jgi:hypothetical protein
MISVRYEVMSFMQFQSLIMAKEEAKYISECILAAQCADWVTEPFLGFDLTRLIAVLQQRRYSSSVTAAALQQRRYSRGVTAVALQQWRYSSGVTAAALQQRRYSRGITAAVLQQQRYSRGVTAAALQQRRYSRGVTAAALQQQLTPHYVWTCCQPLLFLYQTWEEAELCQNL